MNKIFNLNALVCLIIKAHFLFEITYSYWVGLAHSLGATQILFCRFVVALSHYDTYNLI